MEHKLTIISNTREISDNTTAIDTSIAGENINYQMFTKMIASAITAYSNECGKDFLDMIIDIIVERNIQEANVRNN